MLQNRIRIRPALNLEPKATSLTEAVDVRQGIGVMRDLMTIESILPYLATSALLRAICQKKTPPPRYQFFRVNIRNRLKFVAIEGKLGDLCVCVASGRLGTLPAPILVFKEVGIGSVALHPSCGFRRMNDLIQVLTIANI